MKNWIALFALLCFGLFACTSAEKNADEAGDKMEEAADKVEKATDDM